MPRPRFLPDRPKTRIALLVVLLGASLALLFRPISEPVTRVADWALVTQPSSEARCRAPRTGEAQWRVDVPAEFASLRHAMAERLGRTCEGACGATVTVDVRPSWVDRPNFFTGFGRLNVPVVIRRQVEACSDTFELLLDARVELGTRGSTRLVQHHAGQLMGGFFRGLYAAKRPWPEFRGARAARGAPVGGETY